MPRQPARYLEAVFLELGYLVFALLVMLLSKPTTRSVRGGYDIELGKGYRRLGAIILTIGMGGKP